jgi:hypothetical protein
MVLEGQIEGEFERFARFRAQLEKLVPAKENAEDDAAWVYGEQDEDGWRVDEDVDPYEQIETVRAVVLDLLDSTYKLEGLLHTRGVLMN